MALYNENEVAQQMNKEIQSKNGDGMTNVTVFAKDCFLTSIPFYSLLYVFGFIFPTCNTIKVSGDIVKYNQESFSKNEKN
jgi:hypothetical protein